MAWIKAKNGNVFEVEDDSTSKALFLQGHEVWSRHPKTKGAKKWESDEAPEDDGSDLDDK